MDTWLDQSKGVKDFLLFLFYFCQSEMLSI